MHLRKEHSETRKKKGKGWPRQGRQDGFFDAPHGPWLDEQLVLHQAEVPARVSYLIVTTVLEKGKSGLGGTIVGVLVRGPGVALNLGP